MITQAWENWQLLLPTSQPRKRLEILKVEIDLPIVRNAPYQHLYDLRNPAARASSSEQNQRFDFFVLT